MAGTGRPFEVCLFLNTGLMSESQIIRAWPKQKLEITEYGYDLLFVSKLGKTHCLI